MLVHNSLSVLQCYFKDLEPQDLRRFFLNIWNAWGSSSQLLITDGPLQALRPNIEGIQRAEVDSIDPVATGSLEQREGVSLQGKKQAQHVVGRSGSNV